MKLILKALSVAVLGAASTFTFAAEPASEHTFSGNISVLSSYNLRGITNVPENKGATLQGGLDYNHASGFYAGWWGSTLDYGSDNGSEFENNFYAGYNGSINEDLAYTVGLTLPSTNNKQKPTLISLILDCFISPACSKISKTRANANACIVTPYSIEILSARRGRSQTQYDAAHRALKN